MMSESNKQWLDATADAAFDGGHIFPPMAACEMALESGYGTSLLYRVDFNGFGMKKHIHEVYQTVSLPTKEFLGGEWQTVSAGFVRYPDLKACFSDRMNTLRRLSTVYPHYAAALAASDPVTYVTEVSKSWSTDLRRGDKCVKIYEEYISSPNGNDDLQDHESGQ